MLEYTNVSELLYNKAVNICNKRRKHWKLDEFSLNCYRQHHSIPDHLSFWNQTEKITYIRNMKKIHCFAYIISFFNVSFNGVIVLQNGNFDGWHTAEDVSASRQRDVQWDGRRLNVWVLQSNHGAHLVLYNASEHYD